MKGFPKTVYVTRVINNEDEGEWSELFIDADKSNVLEEEDGTEVAVYQLVKVGTVQKKSTLIFE